MVIDSTNIKDTRVLLSQTPPNYVEQNYYLKELQDKINADWKFRPNRFDIEEEKIFGEEIYTPIQVVLQSVKSEKGETLSDDWRTIVFKDISKKLRIGSRYRFSSEFHNNCFDPDSPDETKNIWIAVNQNRIKQTASQTVVRCNGTLGSIYEDESGVLHYHYEPAVQSDNLQGTSFGFNRVAIDPRGAITVLVQFNKYTEQYYVNQRFVIGYDQVFKVQNISKTSSMTTYNPKDLGVITLYMQMDQVGALDNLEDRIAYNGREDTVVNSDVHSDDTFYKLAIENPQPIPEFLTTVPIVFNVYAYQFGQRVALPISVTCTVDGTNEPLRFVRVEHINDNSFSLQRLRFYGGGKAHIKCFVPAQDSPTQEEIFLSFELNLGGLE